MVEGLLGIGLVLGASGDGSLGSRVIGLVVLDDGVVRYSGFVADSYGSTLEEERAHVDVVPAHAAIAFDHTGVEEWHEEDGGECSECGTGSDSDASDVGSGLLVEAKTWAALVDDGERADRTGDEEEGWGGGDGPLDGVLAHVNDDLDQHEDSCCEPS